MTYAAPQAAENNNFLIPNATFIVEFVLFVIIFAVLAKFVLPRLQSAMQERRAMVEGQLADSEAARRKLAEAQRAYQQALSEARTEASQIREEARAEAQRTTDALRAEAQAEASRIIARGEEQLRGQREAIMRELRGEIGGLAIGLSQKIVDQPLAQDAQVTTTVDNFVAGLAARDRAGSGADA